MSTTAQDRSVEQGLNRFDLIAGVGDGDKQACAMTLLSWLAGEDWTDHPVCTHPLIANVVIHANDSETATPESRAELVRAGEHGALDTWWIPAEVVLVGLADTRNLSAQDTALKLLGHVAAWKQDKRHPVLSRANLSGAVLSRANLTGAVLSEAVLSRANLSEAVLSRANLSEAVLSGAVLSGADLSEADLSRAVLSRADLSGASLSEADLSGATGVPVSGMPDGWKLDDQGLWVRA